MLKVKSISKNNSELISYNENALIQSGIEITDEVLTKINQFTVSPIEKESVVAYPILLIDDKVTRNSTHYPKEFQKMLLSLPIGEGNVIGASLLLGNDEDHQGVAASQIGRIYEATQVVDKDGHYGIIASAYILRAINQETLSKIDSGIFKEVSISTKVEMPLCSICHQDIRTCEHTIGKEGCYATMTGKGFCAEVSIVAIPGSNSAKILSPDKLKNYHVVNETMLMENFSLMEDKIEAMTKTLQERLETIPTMLDKTFNEFGSYLNDIKASGVISTSNTETLKLENETLTLESNNNKKVLGELEKINKELLVTIDELKKNSQVADAIVHKEKVKLIEETLRLGVLSKSIKIEGKESMKKLFGNMNIEEITSIKDSFNSECVRLYPKIDIIEEPIKDDIKPSNKKSVNIMDFKNK